MGFAAGPLNVTTQPTPAVFHVAYIVLNEHVANLIIIANNADHEIATVIIDGRYGRLISDEIAGSGRYAVQVRDGEALMIVVRHEGEIKACAVFEVDMTLTEKIGAILAPRCLANVIVDQNAFVAQSRHTPPLDECSETASPDTEHVEAVEVL